MATTPPITIDPEDLMVIPVKDFTEAKVEGEGVYDILMRANAAHLEKEFNASRIKGNEYAQIYLGTMQATMETAVAFFIQKYKLGYEAKLLEIQAKIAEVELQKAQVALEIARLEALRVPAEIDKIRSDILVNEANILNIGAETARTEQQTSNLAAEALNIPKQGELLDAQSSKIAQEIVNLGSQNLHTIQETSNAVIQGTVLEAQKCKLDAEYDILMATKLKVAQETSLLAQKVATEKAQTVGSGTDPDSVIGKQKLLYQAQTDGFQRDAEQKAAKLLVDTWNVRRTTDEGTEANNENLLYDPAIGRAVSRLLEGVGA